jgi:hypothetical protein
MDRVLARLHPRGEAALGVILLLRAAVIIPQLPPDDRFVR